MGKFLAIYRLAVRDIRHRPAQALLLLIAIAAGAATLTLGLSLQGTVSNPYARTQAATSGPDVIATLFTDGSNAPGPAASSKPGSGGTAGGQSAGAGQPDTAVLTPLKHASGVTAYSGPFPVTWSVFQTGHTTGTFEVGFWFNDPQAAVSCGFDPTKPTPFNGEHQAGPLAMISLPNAQTGLGPLCTKPDTSVSPARCDP